MTSMTMKSDRQHYGLGAAVVAFLGVLTIANKAVYLGRSGASPGEFVLGMLPELALALTGFGLYLAIASWRRRWGRILGALAVGVAMLFLGTFTLVAAVGDWQTGSIPRLQQLQGLTWEIIAPSVREIAQKNMLYLILAIGGCLLLILALRWLITRVHWRGLLPKGLLALAVLLLALTSATVFSTAAGERKYMELIAGGFFRTDLDFDAVTSDAARQAGAQFFRDYQQKLAAKSGSRYPELFSALKGSNVIYLVMESTRAKDVPLYGGSADMPNMMQARQHMLLLRNLYAQDPRSTKAYGQLDMGRFSLLSWDSYSNNLPWMYPEDGVASRLAKLGYRTYSLVDGDGFYDHHKSFQQQHGYQTVLYRQELNPGSANADDERMLERLKQELANVHGPFYMMAWPIATHHPYGREYWAHMQDWRANHPEGIKHLGAADYARYLHALHETDDWFGQLIQVLKDEGKYENTVIIVTGDHGEAFGEHEPGNVFHGNGVYQESTHVAGFIYSPKINGLIEDDRYFRLVDIPATIQHLATGDQYLLNSGRSIFNEYEHQVPVYLFNSWAGAVGIIYEGYKLWHREKPGSPVYLASMAEIQADPSLEFKPAEGERAKKLLGMLNTWESAMKSQTAELLSQKPEADQPLDDVVRVYCDDGKGFREAFKNVSDFTGFSGTVTMPVNKNCRSLRIAPIQSTKVPPNEYLTFKIESLDVAGEDRSWDLDDVRVGWSNDVRVLNNHSFVLPGGSPAFDYKLDSTNHHIKSVSMKVSFEWKHGDAKAQ